MGKKEERERKRKGKVEDIEEGNIIKKNKRGGRKEKIRRRIIKKGVNNRIRERICIRGSNKRGK